MSRTSIAPASTAPGPAKGHDLRVQIARTYANGSRLRPNPSDFTLSPAILEQYARMKDPFKGYAFAPNGSDETWRMVKNAIAEARRFIYVENQYRASEHRAGTGEGA